ncbi:MAG TPA: hypothetical protein VGD78_09685 [Chthoniobacterales bacterium]
MERSRAWKATPCRSWIGFHVQDFFGWPIGRLASMWVPEGKTEARFLGIRTAWVTTQDLLVPAQGIRVSPTHASVRVPYGRDVLCHAPRHPVGVPLSPEREREVYVHYGLSVSGAPSEDAPAERAVSGCSRKARVPLASKPKSQRQSSAADRSGAQTPCL